MNGRAVVAALVLVTSGVFASAGAPAAQAATGGETCVSGGGSGGTSGGGGGSVSDAGSVTMWEMLSAHAQAVLCPSGTSSSGSSANWSPPQCWWGPEFSPQGLAADIAQLGGESTIDTYMAMDELYAANGPNGAAPAGYVFKNEPPWYMYNENVTPAGEWWGLIWNDVMTGQGISDCLAIDTSHSPRNWYWVTDQNEPGTPTDAPAFSDSQLALYLEGKVKLTPLPIKTDPSLATTKATVGLPTWVWADAADTTVQDQLCLAPQYGNFCVNMTAKARSFTVSSSDPGATLYTDCKANADGTVGTPYSGQSGNPPCGVTFSQPGNWTLDMVTTWNVQLAWDGGALNDPAYTETDLPANVQEVQAINNGGATTATP